MLKNLDVNTSCAAGTNTVTVHQTGDTYFNGPNGEFTLNTSNADFKINGTSVPYGQATGGLFGPNGEALGGTAAMHDDYYDGAVIGFEGTKQ